MSGVSGNNESTSLLEHLNSTVRTVQPSMSQSVQRYLMSAQLLLNQANSYRRAGNDAQLYVMLLRYSSLLVETVPKHAKFDPGDAAYKNLKKDPMDGYSGWVMLLDSCKIKVEIMESELDGLKSSLSYQMISAVGPKPFKQHIGVPISTSLVPEIDWGTPSIPAADNGSLLDALPVQVTARALPPPPQFDSKLAKSAKGTSLEKHGLFVAPQGDPHVSNIGNELQPGVSYPSVDVPSLMDAEPPSNFIVNPPKEIQLGPQELEVERVSPLSGPPDPYHDDCTCSVPAPPPQQAIPESSAPKFEGLRDVHISYELLQLFLRHAESNTKKGIESCGVLAGELGGEESVLRVNRLILPPQKGSRDQVEMLNEEVLLEETMMKGFIVLGWIHTHPEFDCFLSSIDVHTTLSYQLLLEEAIAIVMAPKDKKRKCGVFRLSTPGGLELVKDCQERGFHQHGRTKTGQPVYEVSSHVYINPDMKVVVSDRRAG